MANINRISAVAWLVFVALLCPVATVAATGSAPTAFAPITGAKPANPAVNAPDGQSTVVGKPTDYKVGAQDLLEISVFQVPDLNRTVRVNTNGDVSLPLIGMVHAGGRTVQEVERDISDKLTKGFLQNPQVSVFVKEFTSQRVTLEGALNKPGIYPLTGQTTLLQAIAMSGGLNDMANLKGVVVFRVIDGQKKVAAFDLKQIRKGAAEDPLIYGDDIVVVEESGSKSLFGRVLKAMPVLGVFF